MEASDFAAQSAPAPKTKIIVHRDDRSVAPPINVRFGQSKNMAAFDQTHRCKSKFSISAGPGDRPIKSSNPLRVILCARVAE